MKYVVWLVIFLIVGGGTFWILNRPKVEKLGQPEISGWIAWWKEAPGYDVAESESGRIKTVSPVWWLVNEDLKLENAGEASREAVVARMRQAGIQIYPTIGSELTGSRLSPLFNSQEKTNQLIADLMAAIDKLPIDGIDVDLEGINKDDRGAYVSLLKC